MKKIIVVMFIGLATSQVNAFEMFPAEEGEGIPSVIGAEPVSPKDYPATLRLNNNCTSTIVGNNVIITAAHCVKNKEKGKIFFNDNSSANVQCFHHPNYSGEPSHKNDYALCSTRSNLERNGLVFERINIDNSKLKIDKSITLLGFGCNTVGGHDERYGVLYSGESKIKSLPTNIDVDVVTVGKAALCYGDSGGGAYIKDNSGNRYLFGINSKGNIADTSYLASTTSTQFLSFAKKWMENFRTEICGLSDNAKNCR